MPEYQNLGLSTSTVSIVLADFQPLTAAGLRTFLGRRPDTVVWEIQSRKQFLEVVSERQPHLVIADYVKSSFIDDQDLAGISRLSPRTNVLVISGDDDKERIVRVLQTGVLGYLTKECSESEIMHAVDAVAGGDKFFCPKVVDILLEASLGTDKSPSAQAGLTSREIEILGFLARGNSTLGIAERLHISPHTVQTHRKSIIRKLQIKSPTEFVIHAMDLGILSPRDI